MLTRFIGEENKNIAIYTLLPKWYVFQVHKQECTGKKFKMEAKLISYEMDGVMLYLGYNVNIFMKKYWELLCK